MNAPTVICILHCDCLPSFDMNPCTPLPLDALNDSISLCDRTALVENFFSERVNENEMEREEILHNISHFDDASFRCSMDRLV